MINRFIIPLLLLPFLAIANDDIPMFEDMPKYIQEHYNSRQQADDSYNDDNSAEAERLAKYSKEEVIKEFSYIASRGYDKEEMVSLVKHYEMSCVMNDTDYNCQHFISEPDGENWPYLMLIFRKDKKTLMAYTVLDNAHLKITNRIFEPYCRPGVSGDLELCFTPIVSTEESNKLYWETKKWMRSAN